MVYLLLMATFPVKSDEIKVLDSLISARRCQPVQANCTYTYTLASYAGLALDEAEYRYGPRDRHFQLLGVEFKNEPNPGTWFPGDGGDVIIQLTRQAMTDKKEALFQLGHEIIHLLSPIPSEVNILEEGLATEFSLDFVRARGITIDESYIAISSYRHALKAVQCLRRYEPQLDSKLKNLRGSGLALGIIDADDLYHTLENVPRELVEAMTQPFSKLESLRPVLKLRCETL